ncbi:MAG: hypothetical protein ACFFBP_02700 [Promethearchaeota archaeon]
MFCPKCGIGNLDSDIKFCPSCGAQILPFQNQVPISQSRMTQTSIPQPIGTTPTKIVPIYRGPSKIVGSRSKQALGFSLSSLIFLVIGLMIGALIVHESILVFRRAYYETQLYGWSKFKVDPIMGIIGLIPAVGINILGLVFAIIARINACVAKSEIDNTSRKAGAVFSILGIIFNIIALVAGLIMGSILLIYNSSNFPPLYF